MDSLVGGARAHAPACATARATRTRIDFSRYTLDQLEKLGGWTSANCTRPQDKVAWIDVDEKWFFTLCVKGRMWHIDADDFNFAPRMVDRLEKAFARKKREKTKGIHAPVSEEWLIPDIVVTTQPAEPGTLCRPTARMPAARRR